MGLQLVSPAARLAVTLAMAKKHLRVEHDEDDDLIEAYLDAAIDLVDGPEGFLGRALVDQTWDYVLDGFPTGPIEIPLPPLIEVVGVFYGPIGAQQELSASAYLLEAPLNAPARIILASTAPWPALVAGPGQVRIRFRAGYQDTNSPPADAVPGGITVAILLTLGDFYNNRENMILGSSVLALPWGAEMLLRRHRVHLALA